MREFKSVSPSQINTYNDCPRQWWFQSVLGIQTPQRPSAALGTAVHEQLEIYMDSGKLPDDSVAGKIAKPGLSLLPEPGTAWTEVKMHDEDTQDKWPKLFLSGLPVNGYIDLLNMTGERPLVLDHKCLPASAIVHTRTGPVFVGDLSGGWSCAAWDGNAILSAEALPPQPARVQPVFSIRLKNGMVGRYGGTHPLLTRRGWVPAADVCSSDEAAVALDLPDTEEAPVPDALIKVSAMLLCDGALASDTLTYTKTGASRAEYMRCLAELGVSFSERGLSRPGRAPYVQVSAAASSPLRAMLVTLGMGFVNSPKRRVPPLLMGMSKRQIGIFLGGMWAGDGAAYIVEEGSRKKAVITFAGRSLSLCENVRDLLLRMGIPVTLTTSSVSYKGERRPYYAATVVGKRGKVDFLRRALSGEIAVGDRCSGRRTRSGNVPPSLLEVLRVAEDMAEYPSGQFPIRVEGPIWWVPVVKCSSDGEERCYDIEVPKYHTFVAEGVITHNTTSDLKYAKTAEELRSDPQMIIYGSFALSACASQGFSADAVDTGHVVYLTKGAPFAKKTTVTLDRKHLDAERAKLEVTVEQMKTHASARSPDAVPGEPTSCSKYGGCFFQDRCRASGLIHSPTTFAEVFRKAASTPDNNTTESLMSPVDPFAALKAIQARKAAAVASVAPEVATPVAPEVAPEVATPVAPEVARAALLAKYGISKGATPSPVLVVAAEPAVVPAAEAPAEDVKTVRKPKGYAEKLAALNWTEVQIARMNAEAMRAVLEGNIDGTRCSVLPSGFVKVVLREVEPENNVPHILSLNVEVSEAPVTDTTLFAKEHAVAAAVAATIASSAPTLTLYIDCFPDKGRDRNYMTLEDVIAPLCAEAVAIHNRGAKDAERVDFYGLIPYNRGPTYIAAMLLKAPPVGILVCSTRYPATNACLEVLVPLADVVVRGR